MGTMRAAGASPLWTFGPMYFWANILPIGTAQTHAWSSTIQICCTYALRAGQGAIHTGRRLLHPFIIGHAASCMHFNVQPLAEAVPCCSLINPEYEVSPCTGSSWSVPGHDRQCKPCKTKCLPTLKVPNNIILQQCSEFSNAICLDEVSCECPPLEQGYYMKEPCSTMYGTIKNATCARVTLTCPRGYYKEANATATSDTDCRQCPTSCPRGYFQRSPVPQGSKLSGGSCPFDCAACSACGYGSYQIRECNATSDTACQAPCPECPEDTYKIAECSGTLATKCWDCRAAPKVCASFPFCITRMHIYIFNLETAPLLLCIFVRSRVLLFVKVCDFSSKAKKECTWGLPSANSHPPCD